jgi:hypothetical protein
MKGLAFSFISGCALSLVLIETAGCAVDGSDPEDTSDVTSDPLAVQPAAINDDFSLSTTDGCGRVDFVDFGPGEPGGGDNDDYLVIHDLCGDHHGVLVSADLVTGDGVLFDFGDKYNGNGLAGDAIIWDPWHSIGNVVKDDVIELDICLSDGPTDPILPTCAAKHKTSKDG